MDDRRVTRWTLLVTGCVLTATAAATAPADDATAAGTRARRAAPAHAAPAAGIAAPGIAPPAANDHAAQDPAGHNPARYDPATYSPAAYDLAAYDLAGHDATARNAAARDGTARGATAGGGAAGAEHAPAAHITAVFAPPWTPGRAARAGGEQGRATHDRAARSAAAGSAATETSPAQRPLEPARATDAPAADHPADGQPAAHGPAARGPGLSGSPAGGTATHLPAAPEPAAHAAVGEVVAQGSPKAVPTTAAVVGRTATRVAVAAQRDATDPRNFNIAGSARMPQRLVEWSLRASGIRWRSNGNCVDRDRVDCTSFEGIRWGSVDGLIAFQRAAGCPVMVSGGTENGHAGGRFSHHNGYKIDVMPNGCIDRHIARHFQPSGVRGDGAEMYRSPAGVVFAREPSHWDITFR